MKQEILETKIQDLVDGNISQEDYETLSAELKSNPETMKLYLAYVDLANMLALVVEEKDQFTPVISIEQVIRRQKRRALKFAVLSAAAILLIGLVTMRLFFVSDREPSLVFEASPGTQFVLTHSGSNDDLVGTVLENGSQLTLSQGTVELTFASGVKSIVTAPADLTLHDDDTLFLNRGTAWFKVSKGAEGFTVKTHDLDIVDLGTEFGVIAHPDNHDELHVLKGKVKVTALRLRKESAILTAGESCRIDPVGRLDAIPGKPSSFLTNLPKSLPYLHWSFDKEDNYQVSGTHPAAANTGTIGWPRHRPPSLVPGKHNTALSLDGQGQHLSTNWSGFSGNYARTVSFWLKLTKHGDHTAFSGIIGWGKEASNHGKWKVLAYQDNPGSPRILRLSIGSYMLDGTTDLADNEWHHIAVTTTGKVNDKDQFTAEFYIDGKRETTSYESAPGKEPWGGMNTVTNSLDSMPVLIGSSLQANDAQRKSFHGLIDEITIFAGHMNQSEIQSLQAQSGQPSP